MTTRVAVFDGGGVRGALAASLVIRLDESFPGFLSGADVFGGASTGALLAAAYSCGLSVDAVLDLYRDHAERIFASRGIIDELTPDEAVRAGYDAQDGLREALCAAFGDKTLRDMPKPVLIPAFNLTTWEPHYFKSWDGSDDLDLKIVDVLLATSAAPTYFPAHEIDGVGVFCDGGIFNNNPSDSMVAELVSRGLSRDSVSLLSVGTGRNPYKGVKPGEPVDLGYIQWLKPPPMLLEALFDGAVRASHYRARVGLGERYFRLNPTLPGVVSMDDPTAVEDMIHVALKADLSDARQWLKDYWVGRSAGPDGP